MAATATVAVAAGVAAALLTNAAADSALWYLTSCVATMHHNNTPGIPSAMRIARRRKGLYVLQFTCLVIPKTVTPISTPSRTRLMSDLAFLFGTCNEVSRPLGTVDTIEVLLSQMLNFFQPMRREACDCR
ncbi:hypothetical protein B0I35DRAFT_248910 [Stachybotrys elegans]|uniref:Secreted protein n=1 Tax=Stachybotrys elegans TaxID=80388 RepID=A0A8K0SRU4_9HYPO|nr:hypothetical protein B0I35DRAFT_248910 [Stachybotrys elegans]